MSKQLTEFLTFHQSSNFHKTVCTAALNGRLNPQFRSVSWRVLLGLLPVSTNKKEDPELETQWLEALGKERQVFGKKLAAYEAQQGTSAANSNGAAAAAKKKKAGPRFGDDSDSDDDGVEEVTDDPLSNKKDSEWQKKFELQKLIDTIDNDLNRLWLGDDDWFEQGAVRACIRKILVTYTAETNLSYRQGMHEIAALIYFWIIESANEATTGVDANPGETEPAKWCRFLQKVCSTEHAIADAFAIFSRVMSGSYFQLCWLYDTTKSKQVKDLGEASLVGSPTSAAAMKDNPGVEMAADIQGYLVKKENAALAKHLNVSLDISPQSYGIRWIRLLFLREVSIPQSASLWDGLFADYAWTRRKGQCFEITEGLLKYVGAAMLLKIGQDLLDQDDYGMCLQLLMKYPPFKGGVGDILKSAVKLLEDKELMLMVGIQAPVPPPAPAAVARSQGSMSPQQQAQSGPGSPTNAASTAGGSNTTTFQASTAAAGTESVDQLRDKQMRMGMILDSVVSRMEAKWFQGEAPENQTPEAKQRVEEDYIMAIAELKKVKDVLLNTIQE